MFLGVLEQNQESIEDCRSDCFFCNAKLGLCLWMLGSSKVFFSLLIFNIGNVLKTRVRFSRLYRESHITTILGCNPKFWIFHGKVVFLTFWCHLLSICESCPSTWVNKTHTPSNVVYILHIYVCVRVCVWLDRIAAF